MANTKKYHVFTDCDLDGAGSYLFLTKMLGQTMPYTTCRVTDFPEKILGWLKKNTLTDYERIYILDLDVSQHPDIQQIVDRTNVTIIDHHTSHIDNRDNYKRAETIITRSTSTCKLIYKHLSGSSSVSLTDREKLLLLMVDDYDAYKFNVSNSYELNIVFWSYQGNRLEKFINDFSSGFVDFTDQQLNIIDFYKKKLKKIKSELDVHIAEIPINGKKYKMVAAFADSCINDIATHIILNYKCDIGFVVNLRTNKVSLRRDDNCTIDLSNLAKKLFDEGGGHEEAAGGILCDRFLTFTKLFKPIKIKDFGG